MSVEFNRQSIAILQKIKRQAKEEQGYEIHYDSPTLEHDLRTLVQSGVSAKLLALIEEFLPTQEPAPAYTNEPRIYRGSNQLVDDAARTAKRTQRIYRGQVVMA
jgi:hypothetical protein